MSDFINNEETLHSIAHFLEEIQINTAFFQNIETDRLILLNNSQIFSLFDSSGNRIAIVNEDEEVDSNDRYAIISIDEQARNDDTDDSSVEEDAIFSSDDILSFVSDEPMNSEVSLEQHNSNHENDDFEMDELMVHEIEIVTQNDDVEDDTHLMADILEGSSDEEILEDEEIQFYLENEDENYTSNNFYVDHSYAYVCSSTEEYFYYRSN